MDQRIGAVWCFCSGSGGVDVDVGSCAVRRGRTVEELFRCCFALKVVRLQARL